MAALYFVATYGDAGLDVEFFTDAYAYHEAVELAEAAHYSGRLDSYTNGEASV